MSWFLAWKNYIKCKYMYVFMTRTNFAWLPMSSMKYVAFSTLFVNLYVVKEPVFFFKETDFRIDCECSQAIFTRGQFWPSGIVIACVCGSVCPCVCVCSNHELVRTITHRPFKLGSPNLDQRCKTPWFGSLLFLGMVDLDLQGQI